MVPFLCPVSPCFWTLECPLYRSKLVFLGWTPYPWCQDYSPVNIFKDIPEKYAHLSFPKRSIFPINVLAKLVQPLEACRKIVWGHSSSYSLILVSFTIAYYRYFSDCLY